MSKDFAVHWIFGIACIIVAFWGNYLLIPTQYVTGAGAMLPAILAHAMNYVPDDTSKNVQAPNIGAESQPVSPT